MIARPQGLQLSRDKGFDLQAASRALNGLPAAKVDRSTMFGNPFPVDVYGAVKAVDLFDRWSHGRMSMLELSQLSRRDRYSDRGVSLVTVLQWMREDLGRIRGKNLACWCALGARCHRDVLLEVANA